mmetsp:Transcript_35938/g.83469  ORF Transcript_35938/g.83469 Transcript_35938/m.83469 type:complete len:88 (-) Transcript_35938:355-618(-)
MAAIVGVASLFGTAAMLTVGVSTPMTVPTPMTVSTVAVAVSSVPHPKNSNPNHVDRKSNCPDKDDTLRLVFTHELFSVVVNEKFHHF